MDPIKLEKFRAMKRYKNARNELPYTITKVIATIFLIALLLSSPLWVPTLKLFFGSIPSMLELMFGPKCFFILSILIVMYLRIELKHSSDSSTHVDIYEDYMKRNTSNIRRRSSSISKCNNIGASDHEAYKVYPQEQMYHEVWGDHHEDSNNIGDDKNTNELKQRSDDLIARVTKQWKHEATMKLCYG